ncbi:MAG: hypothetical protein FJZ92_07955 [Chloroflexi bacterium]|nr:hypothetical protein [Chloroflexota bacterium]
MLRYAVVLAAAALLAWAQGSWDARLAFALQLVGFYGLRLGFLARTTMLKAFALDAEMISANLFRFIAGNFTFLGVVAGLFATGLASSRNPGTPLALAPLFVVYAAGHTLVLIPFAYPAYLVASALVEAVRGSALAALFEDNMAAAKSFLVGGPAVSLSLVTRLIGLFA